MSMKRRITAELSLYPMEGDALAAILAFIEDIAANGDVKVIVNQMSTQITGELNDVMRIIEHALSRSFESDGKQVLVAKFLNSDLPIGERPDLGSPL